VSKKPTTMDLYAFFNAKIGPMCRNCCYFKHGLALMLNTYDNWLEPDYSNLVTVTKTETAKEIKPKNKNKNKKKKKQK